MNREIKFRAFIPKWIPGSPIMREVYTLDFNGYPIIGNSSIHVLLPDNSDYISVPQSDYFLMQWTGLKDKNEKEIYDRDIIKDNYGHIWDVQFINGCFWLHREGHGGCNDIRSWPKDCYPMFRVNHELYSEVIGNLYQSPKWF